MTFAPNFFSMMHENTAIVAARNPDRTRAPMREPFRVQSTLSGRSPPRPSGTYLKRSVKRSVKREKVGTSMVINEVATVLVTVSGLSRVRVETYRSIISVYDVCLV